MRQIERGFSKSSQLCTSTQKYLQQGESKATRQAFESKELTVKNSAFPYLGQRHKPTSRHWHWRG